jgi:hypothetical protein
MSIVRHIAVEIAATLLMAAALYIAVATVVWWLGP